MMPAWAIDAMPPNKISAGKMAPLGKCLLHKHEDLSWDPQNPTKELNAEPVIPALRRQRQEGPYSHTKLSHSRLSKRLSQKNKIGNS